MEYELEEWLGDPEVRPLADLETPLTILGARPWLDASDYVRAATQSAELIPEETRGSPVVNPRAGLVELG